MAEVDVRRGRVDAELHAQWPALGQLALESALGQRLDGVAAAGSGRPSAAVSVMGPMLDPARRDGRSTPPTRRPHGLYDPATVDLQVSQDPRRYRSSRRADARSAGPARRASAKPKVKKLRLLLIADGPRRPRARLDGLRDDDGGRAASCRSSRTTPSYQRAQNSIVYSDRAATRAAGAADRQREPRSCVTGGPDLAEHQERGHRDRGQALLRARGRRLPGHRPRAVPGHPRPRRRPGRLDDHPAVREERARGAVRPHGLPEAARGRARLPPRAPVVASRRS